MCLHVHMCYASETQCISSRNHLGRVSRPHTARPHPADMEQFHHSVPGARCHRPAQEGYLGQPSSWAFGCRGKPWRTEPQDHTQTCTRTSHQPPGKVSQNVLFKPFAIDSCIKEQEKE